MAFGSARGGAPGTYIYESAVAAGTGRASYNTVYMAVAAPAETNVTVFPYNRPISVSSLNLAPLPPHKITTFGLFIF